MGIADGGAEVCPAVREEMRQGCDQMKIIMSGGVASPKADVGQGAGLGQLMTRRGHPPLLERSEKSRSVGQRIRGSKRQ